MSIQPPESWNRLMKEPPKEDADWEGTFVILFYVLVMILALYV